MNVQVYYENGNYDEIDTSMLPSTETRSDRSLRSGPGAAQAWRDHLEVEGFESRGIRLSRSFWGWRVAGERVMIPEDGDGGSGYVEVTLLGPDDLRDVSEVYLNGLLLLKRDDGRLALASDLEGGE